jgi:hypothetical protein
MVSRTRFESEISRTRSRISISSTAWLGVHIINKVSFKCELAFYLLSNQRYFSMNGVSIFRYFPINKKHFVILLNYVTHRNVESVRYRICFPVIIHYRRDINEHLGRLQCLVLISKYQTQE